MLLELFGHEVHGVCDGQAAIDAIERRRPHVALLDIGMPKANGYQVARRIREQAWGSQVYLVALTGWASGRQGARAGRRPMRTCSWFRKPSNDCSPA